MAAKSWRRREDEFKSEIYAYTQRMHIHASSEALRALTIVVRAKMAEAIVRLSSFSRRCPKTRLPRGRDGRAVYRNERRMRPCNMIMTSRCTENETRS